MNTSVARTVLLLSIYYLGGKNTVLLVSINYLGGKNTVLLVSINSEFSNSAAESDYTAVDPTLK